MNKFSKILASALLVGVLSSGMAIAEEKLDGAELFKKKTCASCHGKTANEAILEYPNLAGQDKKYTFSQMKDIASGKRVGSEDETGNPKTEGMKGVMHLVNNKELKAIAKWLSEQESFAAASTSSEEDIKGGKKLYKKFGCASCHGKKGDKPRKGYPFIAGQKSEYLAAQMLDIRDKIRQNAQSKTMIPFIKKASDEDIKAMADYLEWVGRDEEASAQAVKDEAAKAENPSETKEAASGDDSGKVAGWNEGGGEQDEAENLTPDRANGIEVYEVCSACHMLEGWGFKDGTFPQLAGQHKSVLIKQLADIRGKNRDNPTMYPFALPSEIGGPQSMADVTAYIASLPMNPENGVGEGNNLELGEKLYKDNCVKCHGENGEGIPEKYYPLIQAQHYAYLLRQFEWIRDGKRRNANPDMVKQINSFSDEDMKAVVDYVSRMKPPADKLAEPGWQNPDYD